MDEIDYIPRILISSDPYGRYGWEAKTIISDLAFLLSDQVTAVYANFPNYWVKTFELPYGASLFDGIRELSGMFEPTYYFFNGMLFIMDRTVDNGAWGKININNAKRMSQVEAAAYKPKYVTVQGIDGEWREDKYKGKTAGAYAEVVFVYVGGMNVDVGISYGSPEYELSYTEELLQYVDTDEENSALEYGGTAESNWIHSKTILLTCYLRDVFGNKGAVYLSASHTYKAINKEPELPDLSINPSDVDFDQFEVSGVNASGDAVSVLTDRKITIHKWQGTEEKYENPRLGSIWNTTHPVIGGLPGWQPHTYVVTGMLCPYSAFCKYGGIHDCSVKYKYYPIARLAMEYTVHSDDVVLWPGENYVPLDGMPVCSSTEEYGPIASDYTKDSDYLASKIFPLSELNLTEYPMGLRVFPLYDLVEYTPQIEPADITVDDLVDQKLIISKSVTKIENARWDQYDLFFSKNIVASDGYWQMDKQESRTIKEPPPIDPLRLKRMRVYSEDSKRDETLRYPPALINTEMVDWDDIDYAQRMIKNRLRRGEFRRTYEFVGSLPLVIGQAVNLDAFSGPDGEIVTEPETYKYARVVAVYYRGDAKSGDVSTVVEVECDTQ